MDNLVCLPLATPPMLEAALGYEGPANLVAFFWSPSGDEARWHDGRIAADADWFAFQTFVGTPAVAVALGAANLGSSECEATEWLLLNRATRQLAVGPLVAVHAIVRAQWTPVGAVPGTQESVQLAHGVASDEFRAIVSYVSRSAVLARMERQQAHANALHRWLQTNMPVPSAQALLGVLEQRHAR